jgi:hypothetical protein
VQDFYEPKQELKARLQMVEQDGPVEVLIMDHLEKNLVQLVRVLLSVL